MTKQEQRKLNDLITDLEAFKNCLKCDSENLKDDKQRYYFKGAWINVNYCINKIKELRA